MRPVAVLRHQMPDDLGLGESELRAAGVPLEYVELWDGHPLPELDRVSGLVFLGGDMSANDGDRYPFLNAEQDLMRAAIAREVPLLGLCLGAQLLAAAAGGTVYSAPRRSNGFLVATPTSAAAADPLFADFCSSDRLLRWHEDTFTLPPEACLLLTAEDMPNLAFRVGESAWGIQVHIEVDRRLLRLWIDASGDALHSYWGSPPGALADAADEHLPHQVEHARRAFRAFAGLVMTRDASVKAAG